MNVLVLCNDLIFRTKIESTAKSLGCTIVRSVEALGNQPAVALIDLDSAWPDAMTTAEALAGMVRVRVVAFGSHVRADLFEEARAAGVREVMARSAFVNKLPAILSVSTS